jgi:hypothetical protein
MHAILRNGRASRAGLRFDVLYLLELEYGADWDAVGLLMQLVLFAQRRIRRGFNRRRLRHRVTFNSYNSLRFTRLFAYPKLDALVLEVGSLAAALLL